MSASLSVKSGDARAAFAPEMMQVAYRLVATGALCLALTLLNESFLTTGNILNVLRQASLLFFMAAGLTLVILTGGLDLSVGANIGLSACLAATVLKATGSASLAVLAALSAGLTVGFANGLLVTLLRIPSFIATYGMLWFVHGITFAFMSGETIHGFPPGFRFMGSGFFLGIPVPVYLMLLFLALGTALTRFTTFGQEIYAIGANTEAARLSGIPVRPRLIAAYVASGGMAGLASVIFLARLNSAEGDIGDSLTLPAIAAVLIGGTSLFGGAGTLFGTFVGALILTLVLNGMNLLAIQTNWQPLVTGVIIILAVYLDMIMRKRLQS
jgi:ribose transport system permease protein